MKVRFYFALKRVHDAWNGIGLEFGLEQNARATSEEDEIQDELDAIYETLSAEEQRIVEAETEHQVAPTSEDDSPRTTRP